MTTPQGRGQKEDVLPIHAGMVVDGVPAHRLPEVAQQVGAGLIIVGG
jgi:hypothetical protein